jgi:hypothetical protein
MTSEALTKIHKRLDEGSKQYVQSECQQKELQSDILSSIARVESENHTNNKHLRYVASRLVGICAALKVQVQRFDSRQVLKMQDIVIKQNKMSEVLENNLSVTSSMMVHLQRFSSLTQLSIQNLLDLYVS